MPRPLRPGERDPQDGKTQGEKNREKIRDRLAGTTPPPDPKPPKEK
jgi:hypothetical protein